ncbi:asparagine synthase-related protein [Rhodovulum marinum]|uniref:NH(3)-dependent NAD(+) synthetase n=1 Tax=Rhodovulum marinum TaxID=320662 RepID=A0A4R2PZR8_9RHOB|nr:asparagine synthase-related protein [Rhodovulum marinum]TCP41793.1 NH(3)-dependent NAD(+) synthetase [Rhodovulum marinum]
MGQELDIDCDLAIDRLVEALRARVAQTGGEGLLLGLSGGLDSSVLAALAVRALGPSRVHVAYLYDRDSDPLIGAHARDVAEGLGLRLERRDITAAMRAQGIYKPLFIRLLSLWAPLNPLIQRSYALLTGESAFKATLRVGAGETLRPWPRRALFAATIAHVDRGFTARHVFRRTLLEQRAAEERLTLVGAANRSELEVGWFVKGGIDDLPFQPMTGLFKTQVRQLAFALGLPDRVCRQTPSPDMAKGITDEIGIGHLYDVVDLIIDADDRGLPDETLERAGIPAAEIADVRALRRLSGWKRAGMQEPPPVSGRFDGPLRRGGGTGPRAAAGLATPA